MIGRRNDVNINTPALFLELFLSSFPLKELPFPLNFCGKTHKIYLRNPLKNRKERKKDED